MQVWSAQGDLLFANSEAERRRLPEARALALGTDSTADAPAIVDTREPPRACFAREPSGRNRSLSRWRVPSCDAAKLRELLLVLVLGLPIAVAGGPRRLTLARRALAPSNA